jgi:hypothetical protein
MTSENQKEKIDDMIIDNQKNEMNLQPGQQIKNNKFLLRCSFCFKANDDLMKCKYCYELFCKDHIEARTPSDFLRIKGGHSCKEYTEILKNQQQIEQPNENKENNIPFMTIETSGRIKDKKRSLLITTSLIIIIVCLLVVSVGGYILLNKELSNLTDEKRYLESELFLTNNDLEDTRTQLNLTNIQLEEINANLQDNITKNNFLQEGDRYNLHDPLFSDVTEFISSDTSSDIKTEIVNAKEQGIRCALVEVRMTSSSSGVYQLIGFNTTDNEMVYYEPETDYRVFLIIGRSYVDCVQGSPYYTTFDDTITDILVIW